MKKQSEKIISTSKKNELSNLSILLSQLTPEERANVEYGIKFGRMVFKHSSGHSLRAPVD